MGDAGKSVVWSGIEQFSVQGIQFLLSLIIARLITPADYGLIAMVSIFMALAHTLIDSGFGNSLIQKRDRNQIDYSTIFYFNLLLSILLYVVLFLTAPLIAEFYKQPILTEIVRWISLNVTLMGLTIIQRARLTIQLNFKLQACISLISVIVGGATGVYLAYRNYGVWALVCQTLTSNTIQCVLLWTINKWLPSFSFSISSFKRLFKFGYKLLFSGIIHTIFVNIYSLVIGRVYNSADVGLYDRAYTISHYPSSNLIQVITRVYYPIQCEHQSDKVWLENSFIKILRLSCFIIFPIMAFIGVCSTSLVNLILADNWMACAPLVSILCLAYVWIPVGILNNYIILSQGESGKFLKAEVLKKVFAIVILVITLPFGVIPLCWGLVAYNIIDVIIIIFFTKRFFDLGYRRQAIAILPVVVVTAISSVLTWLTETIIFASLLKSFISFFIFTVSYIILSKAFLSDEATTVWCLMTTYFKR